MTGVQTCALPIFQLLCQLLHLLVESKKGLLVESTKGLLVLLLLVSQSLVALAQMSNHPFLGDASIL